MGAWNYLWRFTFSLVLCTMTRMTEGTNLTTTSAQIHVSTDPGGTTALAARNSSAITAGSNATTAPSLLDTSFLSPSTMRMVGGEETKPTAPNGEGSSLGTSARSDAVSSATPTTRPGTTATSMGEGSGTSSSLPLGLSSAVTSHSLSSPRGSTAAAPSPQQSGTSGTTEKRLAATTHPPTTLTFSTLPSTSGITSVQSAAGTAEHMTHSPTTPRAAASTPGTSPATDAAEGGLSSTLGGGTEASAARRTSAPLTQGQAAVQKGTTPSSMGSPLPPTTTASTEQMTTGPPENETTVVTALTTPVPPENETTGVIAQTTPVPPENETTGLTEQTTPVPPENETTGLTGQTTPVPPENETTGLTGPTSNSIFTTTFSSPSCHIQALSCRALLKDQTFNNTLYDTDSKEYKAMAESFETDVVREMRLELKEDCFDIAVLGFRPGSVIADFISLLPKESVDVNKMKTHLSQILKRKFGNGTELSVQPLSVQSSTDNSSAWRVAVIVLGVLLGVALVLILLAILFYIYMRKRRCKYLVEPQDSWEIFSKCTYKMHHISSPYAE